MRRKVTGCIAYLLIVAVATPQPALAAENKAPDSHARTVLLLLAGGAAAVGAAACFGKASSISDDRDMTDLTYDELMDDLDRESMYRNGGYTLGVLAVICVVGAAATIAENDAHRSSRFPTVTRYGTIHAWHGRGITYVGIRGIRALP